MTDTEWRDLCRAYAAASPRPWWLDAVPVGAQPGGWAVIGGDGDHLLSPGDTGVREWADARLMVAAPALFDEVTRLRAALAAIVAVSEEAFTNPTPRLVYQSGAEAWAEAAQMARQALQDGEEVVPE